MPPSQLFYGIVIVLLDHDDTKLTINKDGEVGFITKELDMGNYVNEAIKTGPLVVLSLKRYVLYAHVRTYSSIHGTATRFT